ncbi:hypothetical protein [Qipengyuania sediminis]|uniref:hypothetical protein n=1 Tax=Qipengyuania sediminis TaxID=1532023 RepID=UPI00105A3C1A|nr:hypothetical protein [Qipengyuania sediminis]
MRILRPAPKRAQCIPDFRDEREPADSRRIVRSTDGLDTPPLGRIVTFRHGGIERPVVTRGGLHLRFKMASIKTGMTEVGEGRGEELLAMQCEIDGSVLNFKCHPYRFEIAFGGAAFTYRPDIAILHRDGRIEIVEVKRTPDDIDEDEREKLGRVREFVRRCGWEFSIRYLEEIRGSDEREHNVARFFGRRANKVQREERVIAEAERAKNVPIRWDRLAGLVSPYDALHGDAVVERLVAGGMFFVDLDSKMGPASVLTPTTPTTQQPLPGFEEDEA